MTTISPHPKPILSSHLKRLLLILLVALIPTMISTLLIIAHGYRVADFVPLLSDEVANWNQINTFRAVGLNGGYFTIYELAPAAQFTHFYTYGPWFPALYGSLARILGASPAVPLLINSLLVGLALILFCRVTRLNTIQLGILALALATSWGMLLYHFTMMQEAYQQSIGIVLASFLVIAFRQRGQVSLRFKVAGLVWITLAAVMRTSWLIFYIPFLALTSPNTVRRWGVNLLMIVVLSIGVIFFSSFTGAPGNNTIFTVLSVFKTSFAAGLTNLIQYFLYNLGRLFLYPKPATDVLQTVIVLVWIVIFLSVVIQALLHPVAKKAWFPEALFHLYNIGITFIAALSLYIVASGGDYRLFATHLMVSILLMIGLKRYRPVVLLAVVNLLFLPVFLQQFDVFVMPHFVPVHAGYAAFKQTADSVMPYDPDAPDAWCNTLLFSAWVYDGDSLDAVPAGIGLSFFFDAADPRLTYKSGYLLLRDEDYSTLMARQDAPELTYLADTTIGKLYRNQNAECASPAR